METAICASITRAAGLGDGFWRVNLRDVATISTAAAMSSDQNRGLKKSSSTGSSTPVVVPPTLASPAMSQLQLKSEQDCFELLALEFASLPDREMVPEGSDAVSGQQQLATPASAKATSNLQFNSNTPTNNLIAKTIRAAMADIKPR